MDIAELKKIEMLKDDEKDEKQFKMIRLKDDEKQFKIYLEPNKGILSFKITYHSGKCGQYEVIFEVLHSQPSKILYHKNIHDFSLVKEYEIPNFGTLDWESWAFQKMENISYFALK